MYKNKASYFLLLIITLLIVALLFQYSQARTAKREARCIKQLMQDASNGRANFPAQSYDEAEGFIDKYVEECVNK